MVAKSMRTYISSCCVAVDVTPATGEEGELRGHAQQGTVFAERVEPTCNIHHSTHNLPKLSTHVCLQNLSTHIYLHCQHMFVNTCLPVFLTYKILYLHFQHIIFYLHFQHIIFYLYFQHNFVNLYFQ